MAPRLHAITKTNMEDGPRGGTLNDRVKERVGRGPAMRAPRCRGGQSRPFLPCGLRVAGPVGRRVPGSGRRLPGSRTDRQAAGGRPLVQGMLLADETGLV